jgi:hypothetical protein
MVQQQVRMVTGCVWRPPTGHTAGYGVLHTALQLAMDSKMTRPACSAYAPP